MTDREASLKTLPRRVAVRFLQDIKFNDLRSRGRYSVKRLPQESLWNRGTNSSTQVAALKKPVSRHSIVRNGACYNLNFVMQRRLEPRSSDTINEI
ncbi:hypothetical protein [Pseudooceanicola spongiae]|uniref:Uncharacterized protein n=1 Tax=Pseudooceanicola spongiae TaxID=2613965 RepID=A0A7L9WI26_9RHOB|nr:hypothetical protein [Pseudooceanicola spongiae]QOL80051.1 hypothetical protein F3W81_03950 [Pseudooceanicola spongiae]